MQKHVVSLFSVINVLFYNKNIWSNHDSKSQHLQIAIWITWLSVWVQFLMVIWQILTRDIDKNIKSITNLKLEICTCKCPCFRQNVIIIVNFNKAAEKKMKQQLSTLKCIVIITFSGVCSWLSPVLVDSLCLDIMMFISDNRTSAWYNVLCTLCVCVCVCDIEKCCQLSHSNRKSSLPAEGGNVSDLWLLVVS